MADGYYFYYDNQPYIIKIQGYYPYHYKYLFNPGNYIGGWHICSESEIMDFVNQTEKCKKIQNPKLLKILYEND